MDSSEIRAQSKDVWESYYQVHFKTKITILHETFLLAWHIINAVLLIIGICLATLKVEEKYKRVVMIAILTLYGMYVIAEQSVKFLMFNVDALPYLDGILFYCYFIFTYLGNRIQIGVLRTERRNLDSKSKDLLEDKRKTEEDNRVLQGQLKVSDNVISDYEKNTSALQHLVECSVRSKLSSSQSIQETQTETTSYCNVNNYDTIDSSASRKPSRLAPPIPDKGSSSVSELTKNYEEKVAKQDKNKKKKDENDSNKDKK